jgi:drug/metabolite transporter (DMT)-like permease
LPAATVLSAFCFAELSVDPLGLLAAVASGALTSGVGYAIWYAALTQLRATHAAVVQLSVPVIAALLGLVFLAEPLTLRWGVASVAILGGIGLSTTGRRAPKTA